MPEEASVTVYYDGACPLCSREIDFYRRFRGASNIVWIDIADSGDHNIAPDLPSAAARARFHVRTSSGTLLDGGAAFAHLWSALPAFRWAGLLFRMPPLGWCLDRLYDGFLKLRPRLQRFAVRHTIDSKR
ncbi:MAG: hypothetical protein CMM26_08650 [Rhodospirillaceae bacterium]|nr:hypothetical protein [Rhodospirillaceae bacterium]|tara:strand:+ start:1996 stop:2385 length:390 start_codon:yes stop_codon:yes gene_type:complete